MQNIISDIGFGEVLEKTCDAFDSGKKIVIHKGGTGSGKTEDLMLYLMFEIASEQKDKIITIVSESRPHLDIGVIRILKKYLLRSNLILLTDFNETKGICHFHNTGSLIEFFSADRIDKALGARRDWLYGNEINSLKKNIWSELARRSENIIADFNPTIQFWLEDWLEFQDDYEVIASNYLDNPFLPETEKQKIIKQASRDPNFHRIHILCEYGGAEGLIFPNWSYGDFDDSLPFGFGLDFGFHPDPDALVKVAVDEKNKKIYAKECFYINNQRIKDLKENVGLFARSHNLIIADSEDPRMISEIRDEGFNIKPVKKSDGSVLAGIRLVSDYDIVISKDSVNLVKELRNHTWNDKRAGIPNKGYNHLISGMIYYVQSTTMRGTSRQKWSA